MMRIEEDYPGIPRTHSRTFSYHIIGPFEDGESLQISGLGLRETMKPCWNRRPGGNEDYLALYFYDPVEFFLGDREIRDVQGKWIILSPRQPHSYGSSRSGWSHSWIHFSGSFIRDNLKTLNLRVDQFLDTGGAEDFETMLIRIHEEIYHFNPPDLRIVKDQIRSGLIRIARSHGRAGSVPPVPDRYLRIRQMLDFRYAEAYPLRELASLAGCSIPHFSQMFKSYFQTSPIDYLVNRRITMARHFLKTTDLAIGEISRRTGYEDVYYFSRLFKSRTGCSPRSYRSRYRDIKRQSPGASV